MKDYCIHLPLEIYSKHLKIINGVSFTHREIDLISCILNGRSAKTIPSLLSISPKTVGTHLSNIRGKAGCSSRESIIDFIEKSDKLSLIKNDYYSSLLTQITFEKIVTKLPKSTQNIPSLCHLICEKDQENSTLLHYLEAHFKLLNSQLEITTLKADQPLQKQMNDLSAENRECLFVMVPESINDAEALPYLTIPPETLAKFKKIIFLFPNNNPTAEALKESETIRFLRCPANESYYFSFFEILKTLMPHSNWDKVIADFEEKIQNTTHEYVKPPLKSLPTSNQLKDNSLSKKISSRFGSILSFLYSNKRVAFPALFISFATIFSLSYMGLTVNKQRPETSQENLCVRSDFVIPPHTVLLDRPEMAAELDEVFRDKNGIKVVALYGMGGAGKTTLARQYAHQQNDGIVWEINAETQESLKSSFDHLAKALAKTPEDQMILRGIDDIKDPTEKEEKIIQFVKEKLKLSPNWFLIFDNVEKLTDIYKHFPQDYKTWGNGKIILTTRDTNIQNYKPINHVLHIGELNSAQKLSLYMKIIINEGSKGVSSTELATINTFLAEISPYPLDISIAAYYIKTTGIPYDKYLKRLNGHDKDFVSLQKNLLNESGNYTKTRYSIITFSLEHLIEAHKDFADLLLFVSLLDSQNIPIEVLEKYKTPSVVDSFIYHLKKFSLIREDSCGKTDTSQTFSIHRSTQEISLNYLVNELGLGKNNPSLESITETLDDYINEEAQNSDDFGTPKLKALINHSVMFLNHLSLLSETSVGIMESQLGRLYNMCEHDPKKARPLVERGLIKLNKFNADNTSRIAQRLVWLGNCCYNLGNFENAKYFIEQGLKLYEKNSFQDSPRFGMALRSLGLTVSVLGNYRQSKDLFEKSLGVYRKCYSDNHIKIAEALTLVGCADYNLGYYETSKIALEQSIVIFKKNSPDHASRFGESLIILGNIYIRQGNYRKAKDILEESLSSLLSVYPEDHYVVMWANRTLGSAYQGLQNYKEAKILLEKSVLSYEKFYGRNHTETSEFILGLGELYLAEGNFEKAESLMKESLDIFRENNHALSYATLESLADLYLKKSLLLKTQGEKEQFENQALNCLKQALESVKVHFPNDSLHIVRIEAKFVKVQDNNQ